MDIKSAVKLGIILAVFCVISAGLLAYVYLYTKPMIDLNYKLAFEKSLKEVVPGAEVFEKFGEGTLEAHRGMSGGMTAGFAFTASPRGYSGNVEMLVGIDPKGVVEGVKILNQRETPGLGNNVTKPKFLDQFKGKTVKDKLMPKEDIDAVTGATISSKAVAEGVRGSLKSYESLERF